MNNGDAKQILLVNENRFDWSDFEIPCLLLKTGLTGVILKYIFRHNYSSPYHQLGKIDPLKTKETPVKLAITEIWLPWQQVYMPCLTSKF